MLSAMMICFFHERMGVGCVLSRAGDRGLAGRPSGSLSMIFDLPTIDKYPYIVGPLQPQIPTFSESGPSNVRAVRSAGPEISKKV